MQAIIIMQWFNILKAYCEMIFFGGGVGEAYFLLSCIANCELMPYTLLWVDLMALQRKDSYLCTGSVCTQLLHRSC